MTNRVSTGERTKRLADILTRVHEDGERFVIERDGQVLATLAPMDATSSIIRKYGGEFFPATASANAAGMLILDYFQTDEQTAKRKGVIWGAIWRDSWCDRWRGFGRY